MRPARQLPGFESLLDLFGVKIDHTLVVEGDESQYYRSPAYLVPTIETHGVTAGLTENQQVAVLPYATSLTLPAVEKNTIEAKAILTTSKKSYAKVNLDSTVADKEEGDIDGPLTVALALRKVDADNNDAGGEDRRVRFRRLCHLSAAFTASPATPTCCWARFAG